MSILHLILHREFFDQIAARTKRIEYRANTAYWRKRLRTQYDCCARCGVELRIMINDTLCATCGPGGSKCIPAGPPRNFRKFDEIHFTNGYGKHRPFMRIEHIVTDFAEGPFGNGFRLHLGEIREFRNYKPFATAATTTVR